MMNRRDFLKLSAATSAALFLYSSNRHIAYGRSRSRLWRLAQQQQPTLDPLDIPKYVDPLVIPPVVQPSQMPGAGRPFTEYRLAARQFQQQILPASFPKTTVWGYGNADEPASDPATFHSPSFTIEARKDHTIRVHWINQLVDNPGSPTASYLPHLLPVDPTLHWANPPGPIDSEPINPDPYTGPVPIVTHLHGSHVPDISDGYPEAWYLPAASNLQGFTTHGSHYRSVAPAQPGAAVFEYPNDQRAATLWYHDHVLGITRINVYAGLAGFYMLRDDVEDSLNLPGPAPRLGDAPGTRYYEIPIAIQDRSFNEDGSLFYPDSRLFFDGDEYPGPFIPETDVPPIWNPEFFGNAMMVNGKTWPYLEVEPRKYRLRLLNGCNSRFLILKFDTALDFHWIGNEGGLLPDSPVVVDQLLLAPAERADVVVDFSEFLPGDELFLLNLGPDHPFGELPVPPEDLANPETTGQVMQFKVVALTGADTSSIPAALPPVEALTGADRVRKVTLHELMGEEADIPVKAVLGTPEHGPLDWHSPITEKIILDQTEIWEMGNFTADAHPIHLHQVLFQVLNRVPVDAELFLEAQEAYLAGGRTGEAPDPMDFATGDPQEPEAWEKGWKETVIAYPGQVTRIIAHFDLAGLYVWHCHILEHEDNEMMRPMIIEQKTYLPITPQAPPH